MDDLSLFDPRKHESTGAQVFDRRSEVVELPVIDDQEAIMECPRGPHFDRTVLLVRVRAPA
jgi:hypothetical protein